MKLKLNYYQQKFYPDWRVELFSQGRIFVNLYLFYQLHNCQEFVGLDVIMWFKILFIKTFMDLVKI